MSKLFDDASLAMIPSAYKDGKLYSIRPTDGSGDFTFSRGSNLAATRVNEQGLIEKGRENLLLQSNQFETSPWNNTSISFASSQSGYDGSSDAWIIERVGVNGHIRQTPPLGNVFTFSIYAKANTLNWVRIRTASVQNAYFNLDPTFIGNRIGYTQNVIDATITDIGNGWFRCTATAIGYDRFFVYPAVDNQDTSGTSGSIYLQDAQSEQGLVATDYIETGASTAQAGILEDMPRLDYSGGASCPSLLLEPSRTNLIGYSEYLNAFSSKSAISVTSNADTSPDGLQNASKLIPDTSNSANHYIRQDVSVSSGTEYVISFFAKKGEYNYVSTYISAYSTGASATWDLNEGSVILGSPNADIEDYGNGWYRCIWKGTTNTTSLSYRIYVSELENRGIPFTGDGVKGAYVWGAQLEQGSYPTSYIPTYGSSVTRGADFATKTGLTSSINSTKGTMFLDFKALANAIPSEYSYFSMTDGTYNNRIAILQSIGANNQVRVFAFVGNTKVFDMTGSVSDITAQTKVALRYAENAFDLFINGAKVSTDTSGAIFPADTLDRVSFSEIGTTASTFKGKVSQVSTFPTALTDSECIALTSL